MTSMGSLVLGLVAAVTVAAPTDPASTQPLGPWAAAEVWSMAPWGAEDAPAALHQRPEAAYALCRARWRRLGAVVCGALSPTAALDADAGVGPSGGALEWQVLRLLGEGAVAAADRAAHDAARLAALGGGAALQRLDAAADALGPTDLQHRGRWRRLLDGTCARLASGLAWVLGRFDSGGASPYAGLHGAPLGSPVALPQPSEPRAAPAAAPGGHRAGRAEPAHHD